MLLLQCTSRGSIFSSVNAGRKICPSFRGLATNTVRSSYARFCRFCYPGRRFCVNFKCISTTVSPQTIQAVFALATLYHGVLIGWMLVAPRSKRTKKVASSNLIFVPIALAYGYLLFYSWQPDTFSLILPGSLKAGFSALEKGVPIRHTLVLSAFFGPLGLLSHFMTQAIYLRRKR
eukprot:jgi/Botrbrau1/7925/Bobra.9_2s0091.3